MQRTQPNTPTPPPVLPTAPPLLRRIHHHYWSIGSTLVMLSLPVDSPAFIRAVQMFLWWAMLQALVIVMQNRCEGISCEGVSVGVYARVAATWRCCRFHCYGSAFHAELVGGMV